MAVLRSGPDDRYDFTMWFDPPWLSAADVSVKNHHTPELAAYTRCDCDEKPLASAKVPATCVPTSFGPGPGGGGGGGGAVTVTVAVEVTVPAPFVAESV